MTDDEKERAKDELIEIECSDDAHRANLIQMFHELLDLTTDQMFDVEKHGLHRVRKYAIYYEINDTAVQQIQREPASARQISDLMKDLVGIGRKYELIAQFNSLERATKCSVSADAVLRELGEM